MLLFLSISKRSLSIETKAISMPEKKAEKAITIKSDITTVIIVALMYQFLTYQNLLPFFDLQRKKLLVYFE